MADSETKEEVDPKSGLNLRQERFCQLYATDREFFGNGVETYLEVYDIDRSKPEWNKTARVCASQLLAKPSIYNRINALLEEGGLNDVFVDKQLKFLLSQQVDFTNKLGALREYNKLKQRIVERQEVNGTITVKTISYGDNPTPELPA